MKKINCLGQSVHVLAVMAIATTGMSIPAIAGSDIPTSQETLKVAQASLAGQCRAAKLQIPVFRSANTTSEAVRLLAANEQVTLADIAVDANGFISISSPVVGYVQATNLKPCGDSAVTPPSNVPPANQNLCRRVARPSQGLAIRREPSTAAVQVGGVRYLGRVTLTTSPATLKRADNRDWVEISSPVRGWVSNGLVTESKSNLVYCQ
ncbi:MAG TPA: SH3 domain-containing protein [Allocoleopsis sp.]